MNELYIKPLQTYLRNLCIEHVLLMHVDDSNEVFVRLQTHEDVMSIPYNASNYFVIVDNLIGRAIGEFDDNRIRQELTMLFLKRALTNNGEPYDNIETAQQEALEVMFDFYSRMKQDYYEDDCGPLKNLLPEQMSFEPVEGPVEEYHYGWLMTIPFDLNLPGYDASKWNRL